MQTQTRGLQRRSQPQAGSGWRCSLPREGAPGAPTDRGLGACPNRYNAVGNFKFNLKLSSMCRGQPEGPDPRLQRPAVTGGCECAAPSESMSGEAGHRAAPRGSKRGPPNLPCHLHTKFQKLVKLKGASASVFVASECSPSPRDSGWSLNMRLRLLPHTLEGCRALQFPALALAQCRLGRF